jgi:hypothetical protein
VRNFVDTVVQSGVSEDSVRAFFVHKEFPPVTPRERLVQDLVSRIVQELSGETGEKAESAEAQFSGEVFQILDSMDDAALGDEAFWSYLAVRFFWPFIFLRQQAAWLAAAGMPVNSDEPDHEKQKLERYLIGKDHYQIPLRMYLRAQSIRHVDDYSLANVPGTDFWRSQVLGVRTSVYPPLARSVARNQLEKAIKVELQRPLGRRVNRLRANIEFAQISESEADEIVSKIWQISDEDVKALSEKKAKAVKKPKKSK